MVRTILNNAGPHVTHKTRPDECAVGEHLKKMNVNVGTIGHIDHGNPFPKSTFEILESALAISTIELRCRL